MVEVSASTSQYHTVLPSTHVESGRMLLFVYLSDVIAQTNNVVALRCCCNNYCCSCCCGCTLVT